ncbi:unnamed protein product [Pedinophyceae sp. YPF-701]|nr:unnamed protein product [Pedinophyceae sp. YPF-701]
MRAMGDMGDLATICSNPRETYRAVKNLQAAANAMKRRATRAMRVAAAETFALGDGDHDPPRLVFMTCGDGLQTHDVCPRPEALHLADFVKLVFREDGSLNLGPCSLLELLASAWIQSFPESDLLLSERGEYCLTPAVLAGLLLEAEEMCTPPEEKRSLHDGGLPRLRETFDVHVRPLLSRVDGGGVLLPAARTATWLPGVDRLPMAFRAGKQGLPKSLRMAAHQARYDAGGGPIRERIR